jgi:hypothetical protein
MLELRMRIEEVKHGPDRGPMEKQLAQRRDGLLEDAAKQFERLDTVDRAGVLTAIRQTLNATKFIQGLLRDLREE